MATSKGGRRAQKQREQEPMAMKENLDRKYKPFFDQHAEHGGIPLNILRETLRGAGDHDLPQDQLEHLLHRADTDRDGVLDYEEFVKLMTTEEGKNLTTVQLSKFQVLVRTAVSSVAPRGMKASDGQTEIVDEYINHYNCYPPPLFMIIISIIELGVFIGYAVYLKGYGIQTTLISGAPLASPLTYDPYRRYEAWRFLTYMFIHDGIKHIVSNLIFQLLLGIPLEMVHKFWRVGLVYLLGVIAGSLCTSVVDPKIFLVGASGGCYALIGAHFATIILNWKEMTHDWMGGITKFLLSGPVKLIFWSVYAIADTAVAIYSRYTAPEGARVAYAAHFAGLAAGVLMGVSLLRNINRLWWEDILWWVCLIIYLVLVLVAVCLNGFLPDRYYPTDWTSCCPCRPGMNCPIPPPPGRTLTSSTTPVGYF